MSNVTLRPSLTDDAAARITEAAIREAHRLGVPQVVAVVDDSGILKSFRRMDGSPVASVTAAQHKAFTALLGVGSGDLFDAVRDSDALRSTLPNLPRMALIAGGLPVVVDGALVGAIGVGGRTLDQDLACALAGLEGL
ncbi:MAG: heme-binding protein [Myxococcota bacterium]